MVKRGHSFIFVLIRSFIRAFVRLFVRSFIFILLGSHLFIYLSIFVVVFCNYLQLLFRSCCHAQFRAPFISSTFVSFVFVLFCFVLFCFLSFLMCYLLLMDTTQTELSVCRPSKNLFHLLGSSSLHINSPDSRRHHRPHHVFPSASIGENKSQALAKTQTKI